MSNGRQDTNKTHFLRRRLLRGTPLLSAFCLLMSLTGCETTGQAAAPQSPAQRRAPSAAEAQWRRTHFADGSPIVTARTAFAQSDSMLLTFAGDLMAHKPNWSHGHFDEIYRDISPLLTESDFAFANMETPVYDGIPYDTYPQFNVHGEYVQAAIDAGFNVFSLANNHTNDQYLKGIQATKRFFDQTREKTAGSPRPVYAAGLKETSGGPLSYQVLQKDGWTILFVALTEILNRPDYSSYIDFLYPTKKNRASLSETLRQLREAHPCDLFVASVHCAEPEYILTVQDSQRDFYYDLLEHGVDVVWVNHPHVAKKWEVVTDAENVPRKLIFYSMGNSISAQRVTPNWANPAASREYTGEGYLAQVRYVKDSGGVRIALVNPVLLTTYITPDGLFVIRRLTEAFIQELQDAGRKTWATYLQERKKLMDTIQGTTIWH